MNELEKQICSILSNPERKDKCKNSVVAFNQNYRIIAFECNKERAYFEAVAKGCVTPLTVHLGLLSYPKGQLLSDNATIKENINIY
jgi:hypothetical protein